MKIDFANLQYQYQLYKQEIDEAIHSVLDKSNYILGEEVTQLEKDLESFTGANHAISCSNGTDALLLAMMALDIEPNDEIITPTFTFIATAETIAFMGAKPVFVDIDERTYNIDPAKIEDKITAKTKAIMPVSLFGQPADLEAIQIIADKYNLKVIIDGAQSFGSTYKGKTDSNLGDISTTSFFPAKPLGCYGDGGAVFTNNEELAVKIKQLRTHGQNKKYHHKYIGMGGRLDTIQAAILNVKLYHYKKDLALRQNVAARYDEGLKDSSFILPVIRENIVSVYAQYSIQCQDRGAFQEKMKNCGIPTAIYYPKSLHLQECFNYLGYKKGDFPISENVSDKIISLPINPYLKDEEINYILEQCLCLSFN
jgi:UDP-2-acetamido-2-deoxy-ribo-hexuluronate aminotransferase